MDFRLLPVPQATLVIILGASRWPYAPDFVSSPAFAQAASSMREYFFHTFQLPPENLLWLFDTSLNAGNIDKEICKHLDMHRNIAKDLIFYYVGHGSLTEDRSGLYLAIYDTQDHNPEGTSIEIKNLAKTLKKKANNCRCFMILDCCYAAAAIKYLQATDIAENTLKHVMDRNYIEKGFTALFSSGAKETSVYLPDHTNTFFSSALLQALFSGDAGLSSNLSLKDIHDLTEGFLTSLYNDYHQKYPEKEISPPPKPHIYSPDQKRGDIAKIPIFPNRQRSATIIAPTSLPVSREVLLQTIAKEINVRMQTITKEMDAVRFVIINSEYRSDVEKVSEALDDHIAEINDLGEGIIALYKSNLHVDKIRKYIMLLYGNVGPFEALAIRLLELKKLCDSLHIIGVNFERAAQHLLELKKYFDAIEADLYWFGRERL